MQQYCLCITQSVVIILKYLIDLRSFSLPFRDIIDLRAGKIRDAQFIPSDDERGKRSEASLQSEPVKCV